MRPDDGLMDMRQAAAYLNRTVKWLRRLVGSLPAEAQGLSGERADDQVLAAALTTKSSFARGSWTSIWMPAPETRNRFL